MTELSFLLTFAAFAIFARVILDYANTPRLSIAP